MLHDADTKQIDGKHRSGANRMSDYRIGGGDKNE